MKRKVAESTSFDPAKDLRPKFSMLHKCIIADAQTLPQEKNIGATEAHHYRKLYIIFDILVRGDLNPLPSGDITRDSPFFLL